MNTPVEKKHIVVIGGGPGGYPAAFMAADHGHRVTLIDRELNPGGVCLYRGCIPSKAILHAAALLGEVKDAAEMGIDFGQPKIDVAKLRGWKESVVKKLTSGLGQLRKARGIEPIQGTATFKDARTVSVATADGKTRDVAFDYAIVATGSSPATLPFATGMDRVMDSTGALALADIPGSLLVVGGGYIGLELGQAYAALGSRVTVVEVLPNLLPGADADLTQVLAARLKTQFAKIMLKTRVLSMEQKGSTVRVKFQAEDGTQSEETFDRVLVSVGRKPNSAGLGLEATAVKVGPKGFIETDAQRRTAERTIFAIGDVAGEPMLAHKATAEARVAVEAIEGRKTVFSPAAIPGVVFTDPEIAWCGLTEREAQEKQLAVKICKFPWVASGRAATLGRGDGLTKLVVDAKSERVLGVGIAGPGAGEMIGEGVLAIEMGAVAEDLALTIHPHPTLSETIMEAAESFHGNPVHFLSKPRS